MEIVTANVDNLTPKALSTLPPNPIQMPDPLLAVEGLTTTFPSERGRAAAVEDVSFTVEAGRAVGLVGESGSGKSVTARSLVRLVESPGRIESGAIRWRGTDLLDLDASALRALRGDEIAMVFQEADRALDPAYTVGQQLVEAIRAHRDVPRAAAREEAADLLAEVGIPAPDERLGDYPHHLSGGMAQRAALAIALANRPRLLIADEPTTGLDVTTQATVLELLADLREREDMALLLVSHDVGVVSEVCDDVLVMYAGRIVERGSRDAVIEDPKHPYTRALLSSVPRLDAAAAPAPIEGTPPNPGDRPAGCRFHPRCPAAEEVCTREQPPEVPFEDGSSVGTTTDGDHAAACYVYTDAYDGGEEALPPVDAAAHPQSEREADDASRPERREESDAPQSEVDDA